MRNNTGRADGVWSRSADVLVFLEALSTEQAGVGRAESFRKVDDDGSEKYYAKY